MRQTRFPRVLLSGLAAVSLLAGVSLSAGCGGGGGVNNVVNTPTTNAKLRVQWPARSRAEVAAPNSAQSFVLTFSQGNPSTGGNITFAASNRGANTAAFTQDYTTPERVRISTGLDPLNPNRMNIRFYAEPNGAGAVVAESTVAIFLGPDGTILTANSSPLTVALDKKVRSVEIPTPPSIVEGQTVEVPFTAKDANGAAVAVSRGSANFSVVSGGTKITLTADGNLTGVAATDQPGDADGNAQIKVAVDGVESAATKVTVGFNPADQTVFTVEIPAIAELKVGDVLDVPFIAKNQAGTVLNKPREDTTFTVVSGADKLNLTTNGNLTAVAVTDSPGDPTGDVQIKVALGGKESVNAKVRITFGPEITLPSGLKYQEIRLPNTNTSPVPGRSVNVSYAGYLASNGQQFDSGNFNFVIDGGRVIAGFNEGVKSMKVGGIRRLLIPSALGYGPNGFPPDIPPNADLIFDVQLVSAQQ
jgi:hypothetical protein